MTLSVKATMTLDLEGERFKYQGAKEARVLELFGEPYPRYSQRLNHLLEDPAALAYAPHTVNRLRRLREARQQRRGAQRLGWSV